MYTSSSDTEHDDWATLIAAHAQQSFLMPNVVLSGPSFGFRYSDKVLRVGKQNQFVDLLSRTTNEELESLEDFYVQQHLEQHESTMAQIALEKEIDSTTSIQKHSTGE